MSARWLEIGAALVLLAGTVAHFASHDPAPPVRTEARTTSTPAPARMSTPRPERATVAATATARPADAVALGEMQVLVESNRISAARARARSFFATYPDSPLGENVERLTGVHPRPVFPE